MTSTLNTHSEMRRKLDELLAKEELTVEAYRELVFYCVETPAGTPAIRALVMDAFRAEIKPEDLVRPDLHEGAAGCVADAVALRLSRQVPSLSPTDRDIVLRMRKSIQHTGEFTAFLDRLLGWEHDDAKPALAEPTGKGLDRSLEDFCADPFEDM